MQAATATRTTSPGLRAARAADTVRKATLADQRKARAAAKAKLAGTPAAPKAPKRAGRSPSDSGKAKTGGRVWASGAVKVLDASCSFSGETPACWALLAKAPDVEAYMAAGKAAGLTSKRLRFCLRHFSKTLRVVRVG